MNYRSCLIAFKNNKGIALRATKITVENHDNIMCVYDNDDIMAIFQLSDVKAVIFADCGSAEIEQNMFDIICDKL